MQHDPVFLVERGLPISELKRVMRSAVGPIFNIPNGTTFKQDMAEIKYLLSGYRFCQIRCLVPGFDGLD